jgi:hypothetical protein
MNLKSKLASAEKYLSNPKKNSAIYFNNLPLRVAESSKNKSNLGLN